MAYIARIKLDDRIPGTIAYVHESMKNVDETKPITTARAHLCGILTNLEDKAKYSAMLATVSGKQDYSFAPKEIAVALFGLREERGKWPTNNTWDARLFIGGTINIPSAILTALPYQLDTLRLLGREEEFRNRTKNKEEYLKGHPDLGELLIEYKEPEVEEVSEQEIGDTSEKTWKPTTRYRIELSSKLTGSQQYRLGEEFARKGHLLMTEKKTDLSFQIRFMQPVSQEVVQEVLDTTDSSIKGDDKRVFKYVAIKPIR